MDALQFPTHAPGKLVPRGEPGQESLCWFDLTGGEYWIEVGDQTLFQYSEATRELRGCSAYYAECPVARLYEDFCDILPAIMEPLPDDLLPYLGSAKAAEWALLDWTLSETADGHDQNTDHFWDLVEQAGMIERNRFLYTGYLSPWARILIWSDRESVSIGWDAERFDEDVPVWSATKGVHRMLRDRFIAEARSFDERFMRAMGERVEQVERGALASLIHVDRDGLRKEHEVRSRGIEAELAGPLIPTDWNRVRAAIAEVERDMRMRSS